MILIRLTELITLPLRVIADLIRNPLPTTHLTKGLRVKPAMTNGGWGLLRTSATPLARVCNPCHTNATHGLQIRASRLLRTSATLSPRNDVHLTPALSEGEGAFPYLETERSRSFGGVRGGQRLRWRGFATRAISTQRTDYKSARAERSNHGSDKK